MITLTVTENTLNGDGRGNFEIADLPELLSQQEFDAYEIERAELLAVGSQANFRELYSMTIIGEDNEELNINFYIQRASSPLVRARFKSRARGAIAYDYRPYLSERYEVGNVLKLERDRARRFRIVRVL